MYEKILDEWLMGAYVSISDRCNYKCVYCSEEDYKDNNLIMTYENFKEVCNVLKNKKVCKLDITGGEPFLNSSIEKIIDYASDLFSTTILTNGSLISKHIAFLKNQEKKTRIKFSVSLDLPYEDANRKTRGKNTLQGTLEGINNLVNMEYFVTVLSTVTSHTTIEDVQELVRLLKRIGVCRVVFSPLHPTGRAKKIFNSLRPSNLILAQINNLKDSLSKKYGISIGSGYDICYDEVYDCNKDYSLLSCKAGITQISIKTNGDVYPCNALSIYMGNIFYDDLNYILHESEGAKIIHDIRSHHIYDNAMCERCIFSHSCTGGCRGMGYGYFNDISAPTPYCEHWHQG